MVLTNSRHERFAQLVAGGRDQGHAYTEAGYVARGMSAHAASSRLLKRQPDVAARIAELQRDSAQDCRMNRKEILDYLVDVIEAPGDGAPEGGPRRESSKVTERVRMSEKLKAVGMLTKMCGWETPPSPEAAGPVEVVVRIGGDAT
jgi:hypothetical protein